MILTVSECRNGKLDDISFELLTFAKKLNQKVGSKTAAVILSHQAETLAKELSGQAIDAVIAAQDPKLETFIPEYFASALKQIILEKKPKAILFPYTPFGADLAPKIAAALKVGCISSCTGVEFDGDTPIFDKPMYNGKLHAKIKVTSQPIVVSMERGAFQKFQEQGTAPIETVSGDLSSVETPYKSLGIQAAKKTSVDISKAKIIVSGGRGLGKKENFQLIKDLASALGAEYAASRPVVDNEWTERDRQVGSSGKVVTPDLYIACGISGAIQHIAGMKKSKVIVAINKDPEAPIFGIATYGIVGDLFKVIPAMIAALK